MSGLLILFKKSQQKQLDSLSKLTFNQYLVGIRLTYKNSKNLYKASRILGFFKMFGPANSLAILSAEEALKCLVLVIQMLGFFPEDQSIRKVFTAHQIKHEFGWWFGLLHDTFEMSGISFHGYEALSSEDKNKMARRYYSSNFKLMENRTNFPEKDWWANANKKKNDGLYVGLDGEPWNSPAEITRDDLRESHREASRILKELKTYLDTFDGFENDAAIEKYVSDSRLKGKEYMDKVANAQKDAELKNV